MADANPCITQSSKKKKKQAWKVSTSPDTNPSANNPFLSLQPYASVTLWKPVKRPSSSKDAKPAATTKPVLTVNTSDYTTLVMSPVSSPEPVYNNTEYSFSNIEVDSPASAPRDQVQKILDAEDLVLVQEPTVTDACSFQEALANALAQCTSPLFFEENIGHSFLIESSINYQASTGVNTLPEWPTTPAALGTAPDTLQL